jgi:uncharacterized protein involved in cysteine biosynthesis
LILLDALRALSQMGDPAFRRVLALGVGLSVALLVALTVGAAWLMGWLVPDSVTLPWIGELGWLDDAAAGGAVLALLVASVFLMIPVAALFSSLFLEAVAEAVEARHYPEAGTVPRASLATSLREGAAYFALLIVANALALVVYFAVPPLAPFVFWGVNGLLLGREYFQVVALRRLPREEAARLRRRHGLQIWAAGVLMAVPLTVPVVNLLVPVLGAATFTHLFHRVSRPRRTA